MEATGRNLLEYATFWIMTAGLSETSSICHEFRNLCMILCHLLCFGRLNPEVGRPYLTTILPTDRASYRARYLAV